MNQPQMRRVLITGIGIIAPSGLGREPFWHAILNGSTLIGRINRFDPSSHACQIGGQVDDAVLEAATDPRKQRTASHATRMALVAAEDSLRDARLSLEGAAPESVGVCLGTALGGWTDGERQYGTLLERGARRVNPFLVSGAGNHGPGVEVANAIGAQGTQVTFSSGCPSSLQAVGYAANLIASGTLDICLAGGAESPLSPMVIAALSRTNELSTTNDDPGRACRPFDAQHNGMVLTEGSCILVLESEERAIQRSAHAYAEVLASISSCDAQGMYGFDPTGTAGGRAVHRLLQMSNITPAELSYVCAHANGSAAFDRKETLVIRSSLGEFAAHIPVSSIKGVLGHSFGAAGAFQTAASVLALEHATIPPTHNLDDLDTECSLNCVTGTPRSVQLGTALVTSYGYGGVNAYLMLRQAG
jgi:3-oxoacyl-(acyl-carrier-protein) synthase